MTQKTNYIHSTIWMDSACGSRVRIIHCFIRFTWCMQSLRAVLKSRTLLWSSRNGNCWISLVWYSFQTVLGAFKVLSALARNLDLSGRQLDQTNSLLTCFVHIAVSLYFFFIMLYFLVERAFLFVCLFVVFSSHERIFHSFGDVTIAGDGLQILT